MIKSVCCVTEVDRKRQSTEPFMSTFISNFLSTLLVVPVSCHGDFHINIYSLLIVVTRPHLLAILTGVYIVISSQDVWNYLFHCGHL